MTKQEKHTACTLLRCVHGDEINFLGGARAVCLTCNKVMIDAPLPDICYYTNEPHYHLREKK